MYFGACIVKLALSNTSMIRLYQIMKNRIPKESPTQQN
jgi:hypothetical protein